MQYKFLFSDEYFVLLYILLHSMVFPLICWIRLLMSRAAPELWFSVSVCENVCYLESPSPVSVVMPGLLSTSDQISQLRMVISIYISAQVKHFGQLFKQLNTKHQLLFSTAHNQKDDIFGPVYLCVHNIGINHSCTKSKTEKFKIWKTKYWFTASSIR